ncbi:polysaccharide biosynthesis C-terminal domain-containing protein [Mycolicibacterium sp. 050158]|uniref:oligosaccharide flippase family protein n=1 Tax=Mycolicibacterium sp. 050158 TaxID=3090602 RepID=UPI00299D4AB7|nr:polysaccharide biosynthesis C-terminal domain-containing protein [Mycolicibacterium sp. 050158]MDX1889025.1 polysaccharide biosynthesis C-terminal domain-containing protein [Mycolicibacterium sp. 050158]
MSEDASVDGVDPRTDFREVAADSRAAARATLAVVASRVVVAGLGWAGSVIVARSLNPTEWGQFSFVFALLGVMSIVTDLGVGRVVLARLIDGDPEEIARTASSFIALRTVLGAIGYALAIGYVVVLGYPGEVIAATAVGGLVVVLATPSHALSVLYQSRHRLLVVSVAESLGQGVQLLLVVVAAMTAPVLLVFVIPPVVNELFKLGVKAAGLRNRALGLRPSRRIEIDRWRPMLAEAVPLAIGFALTIAMMKVDIVMLSLLDTFEAVGQYSIGYKFSDVIDTIVLAAVAPVSTLLVAAWPLQPEVFRARSRAAATSFALAGGVCVVAFWPSARQVISLLYGQRFGESAPAARLLVVGAALMALIILGIFLLTAAERQRRYPVVALFGLALNVGLNLILIPRLSYYGSAIATVVTWAVTLVLLWIVVARSVPIRGLLPVRELVVLSVLVAAVAALGDYLVQQAPAWWPAVSVVGVLVFVGGAVLLGLTAGVGPARSRSAAR